jgi:tRNA A37 threonylcarbamoyladenosine biosynthesis protein TsaE
MNILTADRPIDSPRYTVMQSVAGNEMKFIYPDLFKVEVYQLT